MNDGKPIFFGHHLENILYGHHFYNSCFTYIHQLGHETNWLFKCTFCDRESYFSVSFSFDMVMIVVAFSTTVQG